MRHLQKVRIKYLRMHYVVTIPKEHVASLDRIILSELVAGYLNPLCSNNASCGLVVGSTKGAPFPPLLNS